MRNGCTRGQAAADGPDRNAKCGQCQQRRRVVQERVHSRLNVPDCEQFGGGFELARHSLCEQLESSIQRGGIAAERLQELLDVGLRVVQQPGEHAVESPLLRNRHGLRKKVVEHKLRVLDGTPKSVDVFLKWVCGELDVRVGNPHVGRCRGDRGDRDDTDSDHSDASSDVGTKSRPHCRPFRL